MGINCTSFVGENTNCGSDRPTGDTKTIAQWKQINHYLQHDSPVTLSPKPSDPQAIRDEMRGHFNYVPTFVTPVNGDRYTTKGTIGRCDNAAYITGAGCMFTGTAGIYQLDYNDPTYSQSSQFIWRAQRQITQTKPGTPDTYVPGGYFAQPITRYFEPLTRNKHGSDNRTEIRNTCIANWGPNYTDPATPGGEPRECDEYPFSSTYQSGYYWRQEQTSGNASARSYAVEVIDKSHNNAAGGTRLRLFYEYDHLLDKDPFYVEIINGPPV